MSNPATPQTGGVSAATEASDTAVAPAFQADAPTPKPFAGLRYELSAHQLAELPHPGAPEVAFSGRSNAGKSSAINALANHNRLAFVSKTPGRTQQINFFALRGSGYLVDLPGYGYAKVPKDMRAHWERTLATYLQSRVSLIAMVLIMDARHPLQPLDVQMLDWFKPTARPVHVLLTKSDKLSRKEAASTLADVRARLAARSTMFSAQLFSSLVRTGVEEAEALVAGWLGYSVAPKKRKAPG